jgi:hypothetical protein
MTDHNFKVCAKVCAEQNGRLDAARKLLCKYPEKLDH